MGASLTFGLGVNANESLHSMIDRSIAAETTGLEYLWIADSPVQFYSPIVASATAAKTSRIRIGLGLMSILLHTPRQIADALVTLSNAYGNRFDLCIGAGDRQQLRQVGVNLESFGSLPLRVLEARRKIALRVHKANVRTKIWLGAQGPKMLATAKSFDGVLLNYSKPEMIRWAIREAMPRAKRAFTVGTCSPSYVYVRKRPKIHQLVKVSSAVVALGAAPTVLRRFGLFEKLREARKLARASPTLEAIVDAVPDEVVRDFSVTMKAASLPSYLAELKSLGVRHVVFAYPQDYSVETVRELGKALDRLS